MGPGRGGVHCALCGIGFGHDHGRGRQLHGTPHRSGTPQRRHILLVHCALHQLGARWNAVGFDTTAHSVELTADGLTYTYRLPPELVPSQS